MITLEYDVIHLNACVGNGDMSWKARMMCTISLVPDGDIDATFQNIHTSSCAYKIKECVHMLRLHSYVIADEEEWSVCTTMRCTDCVFMFFIKTVIHSITDGCIQLF